MSGLGIPKDARFTPDTRELVPTAAGCGRHKKRCGNGLGVPPNDERFWPEGKTPGKWVQKNVPAEGEGEG